MVEPRNPLRKYLKDPPFVHPCSKAWHPAIYEFDEAEIIYEQNAYDRFIKRLEIQSPDEHSIFTHYLQTEIPTDAGQFHRWIQQMRQHMCQIPPNISTTSESKEFPDEWNHFVKNSELVHSPLRLPSLRRSYSLSQLDEATSNMRSGYTHEASYLPYNQIKRTYFGRNVQLWKINKVEKYLCLQKECQKTDSLRTGFLAATIYPTTDYGPRRFYVKLTGVDRGVPGVFFSHHYKKFTGEDKGTNLVQLRPDWLGPAVFYDKDADQYIPTHVLSNGPKPHPIILYKLETGEIFPVTVGSALFRPLSEELRMFVRAHTIPCRMFSDEMTDESWQTFVDSVERTGKIYVTAIYPRQLVVGRVKEYPEPNTYSVFCSDPHCMGNCCPETIEVAELYMPRKSRPEPISERDIADSKW